MNDTICGETTFLPVETKLVSVSGHYLLPSLSLDRSNVGYLSVDTKPPHPRTNTSIVSLPCHFKPPSHFCMQLTNSEVAIIIWKDHESSSNCEKAYMCIT